MVILANSGGGWAWARTWCSPTLLHDRANVTPSWMQPVARANPSAIDAARGLSFGDKELYRISHIHLGTAGWHFALWWVVIVVVFTALAVRRYRLG